MADSRSPSVPREPAPGSEGARDAAILRKYGIEPDPVIEAYKRDVDRTLLRQNLARSPEERWRVITQALRLQQAIRTAGAKARGR